MSLRGVTVRRSGSVVVRSVDVDVEGGTVAALLGANGAGKTTLLDAISGTIASEGSMTLCGRDLAGVHPSVRARRGLAHVEQGRAVFGELTVDQNLLVAAGRGEHHRAFAVFPELESLRDRRAELLSGGEQQMLVVARALLGSPRVLMLDELSLGLAPTVVKRLLPIVRSLADAGAAVLLVEQFAQAALSIADHAYVLAHGSIAYDGPAAELSAQPSILRAAYFGTADRKGA
ncbi:MAG: ATP-binding cassette domain-containing protein [bacterium]|nr:ATP-binding cassette domain-containing protein [bacterium]